MSFLSPLFFVGLGAIAVPILVHLIQRERKRVIEFPSLMFVQRIPYQSVRRRRLRHWALLLMRAAAIALIVAAFTRPFLPASAAASLAATGGSREVVILLDQSASMGYGDRWQRAQGRGEQGDRLDRRGRQGDAGALQPQRRRKHARDIGPRPAAGGAPRRVAHCRRHPVRTGAQAGRKHPRALDAAAEGSGAHFRLPEDRMDRVGRRALLAKACRSRRCRWDRKRSPTSRSRRSRSADRRFRTRSASPSPQASPTRAPTAATGVPVSLEIDGHVIETIQANVGPNASTSVAFSPFTLTEPSAHGVVKAGSDPMPADNTFDFVVTPSQSVSVLLVDSGDGFELLSSRRRSASGRRPRSTSR